MKDYISNNGLEQGYRPLIDNAPEAIVILDAETGKFVDFNEKATALFKLSGEELRTKGPADLSPNELFGKAASSYAKAYIEEALNGGNPAFEWIHVDSKGQYISCEVRLARFPPYSQRIVRGSIIDITNRKRAEEQLHYQAALLDNVSDAVVSTDKDFKVKSWNRAAEQLYGWRPEEATGKDFGKLVPVHYVEMERTAVLAEFAEKGEWKGEVIQKNKAGEAIYVYASVTALKGPNGAFLGAVAINRDIREQKEAERKLKETRRVFEEAERMANLGSWDWNMITNDTYWSDGLCNIYGRTKEEGPPPVDSFMDHVHPKDRAKLQTAIKKATAGINPYSIEYRIFRYNDGVERYLHAEGEVFFDENGQPERLVGAVQDITQRKQVEDDLRKALKQLRLSIETTKLGIWRLNVESGHLEWNDQLLEIYGIKREDFEKDLDGWRSQLHPEDKEYAERRFEELMKGSNVYDVEFRVIRPDSTIRHINASGSPVFGPEEKITELIGINIDITNLKSKEEKLKKAQQELSKVMERFQLSTQAAKVGIWDWDVKTDTLVWDDIMFELYGANRSDFTGNMAAWHDRLHPDDVMQAQLAAELALKGEKRYNIEFRIIRPDQSVRYIKAVATVQRDFEGNPVRMIGTNWDITKEKEAERQKIRTRQLELKNKELEQFAYVASHDLKEPLRTVISFAGLLKKRHKNQLDRDANEYLDFIYKASSRMDELINGLLDYSHIGIHRKLITIDCNVLLEYILDDLALLIEDTGAIIEVDQLPQLEGYETELRVLFQNLISNAIKFRKQDKPPVVHISAQREEEYWKFCIADNGIGIEPQYQDRIFAIFQRLHDRDDYEGTGIGLRHCQKIADLHGGRIWVDSQPGEGSSFYFTIPVKTCG